MKTNKWIIAIAIVSMAWVSCDEDEDNPLNKPELDDAAETFVEFAARNNKAEIEFGELAATKATDSLVKSFAQDMANQHTTAQNELEDIADDYDVEWPNDLTEEQDSIMDVLESSSGHTFDTVYMRTQINAHEGAAHNFEIGATQSENARVKAYANKYLPRIEMHLATADSVHAAAVANHNASADDSGTGGGTSDDGMTGDGTDGTGN